MVMGAAEAEDEEEKEMVVEVVFMTTVVAPAVILINSVQMERQVAGAEAQAVAAVEDVELDTLRHGGIYASVR